MSIDPAQYEDQAELLDDIITPIFGSQADAATVATHCQDLLIDDVMDIIVESRAPKLYVFGRSGAGKSSLINALANKQVAEVGEFEPTTVSSDVYEISFPGRNATWDVVDSRGLFESVPADGGMSVETVEKLKADVSDHNPDLLLHVMTPEQVRAGEDDFAIVEAMDEDVIGGLPPRLMCLNKIDTFLAPGDEWPPDENPALRENIVSTLDLVTKILAVDEYEDVDASTPAQGRVFDTTDVLGAFPTYVKDAPYWNLDTFTEVLFDHLPAEAMLQFAQAQRRERLMRRLARKQTIAIANGVNDIPHREIIDPSLPIVSSLQGYLIALIASFSGRELSGEPVEEYLNATPMSNRQKLSVISGTLVDSLTGIVKDDVEFIRKDTYCAGRAAEAYFFDDEVVSEAEYMSDAKEQFATE